MNVSRNFSSFSLIPKTLDWILIVFTVILFVIFPLKNRVLFQAEAQQFIIELLLAGVAVWSSRSLIRSIFRHFWRYHKDIRPITAIVVQWFLSLFVWAVVAFPIVWSTFEWAFAITPVETHFFQTDALLAFALFATSALIVYVYPYLRPPQLRQPIAAEVSVG